MTEMSAREEYVSRLEDALEQSFAITNKVLHEFRFSPGGLRVTEDARSAMAELRYDLAENKYSIVSTVDVRDTPGYKPTQHCTRGAAADGACFSFSHTAELCGNPQPRACGCAYCYDPNRARQIDILAGMISEREPE